ncbi:family 43 glycosylhydrolase [Limibacter armeniacum]|uniref:family 43 glycosylhydrolase n=1 Tax=Limibacter armeniacum TaxID=466084 RepID=UPI002FE69E86
MRRFFPIWVFLLVIVTACQQSASYRVSKEAEATTFTNPIMAGNYGDPSVVRVGEDYYMTHSGSGSFSLLVWHSRDLVHWNPVSKVSTNNQGTPWAPDLVYHQGKFYIYVTLTRYLEDGSRTFGNVVFTADKAEGPWSEPINLNVKGLIDPGHIATPEGKRYLFFEKGQVAELSENGQQIISEVSKVYDGWQYPDEWVVECPCLESPKLFYKDGYCYMVSAMGGTKGPSTSHMAVTARAKDPMGPWENAPNNPLIHTYSPEERWWSQGHATLLEDTEGQWWAVYHAYEKMQRIMGRPTLMLPVDWTTDSWPYIREGLTAEADLPKPAGQHIGEPLDFSNDFEGNQLNLLWRHHTLVNPADFKVGNNALTVKGKGDNPANANEVGITLIDKSFEASIELILDEQTEAGLVLYARNGNSTGIGVKGDEPMLYWRGKKQRARAGEIPQLAAGPVELKIRKENFDVSVWYRQEGNDWRKLPRSFEVQEGHGVLYLSLYTCGTGKATYKHFRYSKLKKEV